MTNYVTPEGLHPIFPGRTKLYVIEVAKVLGIQKHEVIALIVEHLKTGGKSGLCGVSILGGKHSPTEVIEGTPPCCWRVPIEAFDAFVESQKAKGINPLSDFEDYTRKAAKAAKKST